MRALSAAELLCVWERGLAQSPAQRSLTLLTMACASQTPDQLARLSIGQRNTQLLALREKTFGPRLTSLADCPACGVSLELQLTVADVRVTPSVPPQEIITLNKDEYEVRFRLPNSLDLAAIPGEADPSEIRGQLLKRCLCAAHRRGREIDVNQLPPGLLAAVVDQMAQADPQANVQLALGCPQCRHQWQAPLDIASFLWSEIRAWAGRLLREVHQLASAYGWSEAEILALTPARRQAYLEMIAL